MTIRDDSAPPDDARVLRAYREAAARLDEAPSPAARAAVLAAAQRAAATPPPRRWRLPLAAAATVLVGTVAVLLVQRTDPRLDAPQGELALAHGADAPTSARSAAAASSGSAEARRSGTDAAAALRPSGADAARPEAGAGASTPSAGRGSTGAAAQETERDAAAPPDRPAAAADTRTARAATAEPARTLDGRPGPAGAAALPALDHGETLPAPHAGPATREAGPTPPAEDRVTARPVARSGAVNGTPWRADAERWLDRVIALRDAGRHDEADAELALLRARHPDLRIPERAQRAPGN